MSVSSLYDGLDEAHKKIDKLRKTIAAQDAQKKFMQKRINKLRVEVEFYKEGYVPVEIDKEKKDG